MAGRECQSVGCKSLGSRRSELMLDFCCFLTICWHSLAQTASLAPHRGEAKSECETEGE